MSEFEREPSYAADMSHDEYVREMENFECVMGGDEESSAGSIPPPPPRGYGRNEMVPQPDEVREMDLSHNGVEVENQLQLESEMPQYYDDEDLQVEEQHDEEEYDEVARSSGGRRKKLIVGVACIVFLAIILGLSIGLSGRNKDDDGGSRSNSLSRAESGSGTTQAPIATDEDAAPTTSEDGDGVTDDAGSEAPVTTETSEDAGTEVPAETAEPVPDLTEEPIVASTEAPTESIPEPTVSTSSPTMAPEPTASPTISCDNGIFVVDGCVTQGEAFDVAFKNCAPEVADWVALYPYSESHNLADMGNPANRVWSWLCGDKFCRGKRTDGTIQLDTSDLPFGLYEVHMVRFDDDSPDDPFVSYARSAVFAVGSSC